MHGLAHSKSPGRLPRCSARLPVRANCCCTILHAAPGTVLFFGAEHELLNFPIAEASNLPANPTSLLPVLPENRTSTHSVTPFIQWNMQCACKARVSCNTCWHYLAICLSSFQTRDIACNTYLRYHNLSRCILHRKYTRRNPRDQRTRRDSHMDFLGTRQRQH